MARKIEVEIVGDASSYKRALGQAQSTTSKFGAVAKTALIGGAAAGLYALGKAAKIGWSEYNEGAQVAAQTNAVLKSTGGVANVTAKEIEGLAHSLMLKTTFDDEVVQSGENVLLTFRNIRNEAGKGNDIFNEATKLTLDFAQAMGLDLNTAALSVGKALNNPIKGLTRLGRQGVEFTDQQIALITRLQETGHTMEAQKVILEELRKEFGGSAEAAGKTFGGQLIILRNRLDNFLGDLTEKAIPYVQRFVTWIGPKAHAAMETTKKIVNELRGDWQKFNAILDKHQGTVQKVVTVLGFLAKVLGLLVRWNLFLYKSLIKVELKVLDLALTVGDKLTPVLSTLKDVAKKVGEVAVTAFKNMLGPINTVIGAVQRAIGWFKDLIGISNSSTGSGIGAAAGAAKNAPAPPNIPEGATGGRVGRTGLAIIHKGETLVPAGAGWGSGDIVLQVDGREILRAMRRTEGRESRR